MSIKKPTILIVDDMAINIQVLSNILKSEYQIKIATSGEKAIELASKDTSIDLILLDIDMPVMDGYQVCNILKSQNSTRHIPIIFVTAIMGTESEEVGLHLGASDYIVKPFSSEIVKLRVRNQVNLKLKNDLLAQFVMIDGLTHVPDKRAFDKELKKIIANGASNNQLLAVSLINVDHLADYNDNYGHGNGDICLQKIANLLSERHVENIDTFVARYEADCFAVIMTGNLFAKDVNEELDSLIKQVHDMNIAHKFSDDYGVVTVSVGTVIVAKPHTDLVTDDLVAAASKMLAEAKSSGRNKRCSIEY